MDRREVAKLSKKESAPCLNLHQACSCRPRSIMYLYFYLLLVARE